MTVSTPAARLAIAVQRTAELTAGRARTGVGHDDADEVSGTIDGDDAIGFDPLPLLASLHRHGAKAVVIGQVAGILHGSLELTGDLDLLWSGRPDEAPAMTAAFAAVGASLYDDDNLPLAATSQPFSLAKVMFRCASAAGDCCTPALPWGSLDVAAYLTRAKSCIIDGVDVRYLSVVDLLTMRRAVGRPKDLRRVAELEALLGS